MDSFLEQLARRAQVPGADIISADEVANWPKGKLDDLVAEGILTQIENAKGVPCLECEENCYIEPEIRTYPTGETVGRFACTRNSDIGRIIVDLNRLRQWRIDKEKLWRLVYGFTSEWQVLWDDENEEYIPLQEAANLANNDFVTVKNMSRLLKDPEFPVHHMHQAKRCKVRLSDFRKWVKYAQHGKITDDAIEKYLQKIENRKQEAQRREKCRESR